MNSSSNSLRNSWAKQLATHLQARSAQSFNLQVPNMAKRIVPLAIIPQKIDQSATVYAVFAIE